MLFTLVSVCAQLWPLPSVLTGPTSWWWLSPASPGSAAAERRRRRDRPSPGHEPGRCLCPEAARPAGTAETHTHTDQYIIKSYF